MSSFCRIGFLLFAFPIYLRRSKIRENPLYRAKKKASNINEKMFDFSAKRGMTHTTFPGIAEFWSEFLADFLCFFYDFCAFFYASDEKKDQRKICQPFYQLIDLCYLAMKSITLDSNRIFKSMINTDCDQAQLVLCILDARRTRDINTFAWLLLRFFAVENSQEVYCPSSAPSLIQDICEVKKSKAYDLLASLRERSICTEIDKNVLQLNRQFSTKGAKPAPFKGVPIFLQSEEQAFLQSLYDQRAKIWTSLGKNKTVKHTRKKQSEENMELLIKALTKQLETKDQQLETKDQQLEAKDQMLRARDEQFMGLIKLAEVIARGGQVSPEEARKHLKLVVTPE